MSVVEQVFSAAVYDYLHCKADKHTQPGNVYVGSLSPLRVHSYASFLPTSNPAMNEAAMKKKNNERERSKTESTK